MDVIDKMKHIFDKLNTTPPKDPKFNFVNFFKTSFIFKIKTKNSQRKEKIGKILLSSHLINLYSRTNPFKLIAIEPTVINNIDKKCLFLRIVTLLYNQFSLSFRVIFP